MNKVTLTTGLRSFFTLRPKRDDSIGNTQMALGVIAIAVTQMLDFGSTVYGLSLGASEVNGNMAKVINELGISGFLAVKLLGATYLAWATARRRYAPWVVAGIYAAVFVWNLTRIAILQG